MFKPIATKCWEAFLTYKGFKQKRISSSHHQWKKAGCLRSIPVWGAKKEIPSQHLKTSCNTIGCTTDELYEWAEKNC